MLQVLADDLSRNLTLVWTVWAIVSALLVVAAIIDGMQLKVPNNITYPMILAGWAVSFLQCGWPGLGWSLVGTVVGLALLLPAYAIGGMGAGDVKLLAGVGAWVGPWQTWWAFVATAIIGAILAIIMVLVRRKWGHHKSQFLSILTEIVAIKNPEALSAIAAERKHTMMLLPYGIPIAIGTIGYFAYMTIVLL